MKLENSIDEALAMMELRNAVSAHATNNQAISDEELKTCKELSKRIIINYINKIE